MEESNMAKLTIVADIKAKSDKIDLVKDELLKITPENYTGVCEF